MSCIRHCACLVVMALLAVCFADHAAARQTTSEDTIKNQMQAGAAAFMTAFRNRDAEAIAAMWTPECLFINEQGERFFGRDTIKHEYAKAFEDAPDDLEFVVEIDTAHMVGPQTVVVEGRSAVLPQLPGKPRVMSRFTAIHVKRDGKWLVAHLRDNRVEVPPATGKLEDLEVLVGSWQAARDNISVDVTCRWIENNQFLERTHSVTESGQVKSTGRQIIGVHPSTERINSWTFNSDGSHARDVWSPHKNGWVVESIGSLPDGTVTTASYTLTIKDANSLVWESDDRLVGDIALPDSAKIELTRK